MSPRRGRTIGSRRRNAMIGGAAGLATAAVIAVIAISQTGGPEDRIPPSGGWGDTGAVMLDLQAARDLGAIPSRDTWCTDANHCYLFQHATGNATDYGTPGGWHLTATSSPRLGVQSGLPVTDATGWVDMTSEVAAWHEGGSYHVSSSQSLDSTSQMSFSAVINMPAVPSGSAEYVVDLGFGCGGGVLLYRSVAGAVQIYAKGSGGTTSATITNYPADGAWHCVTVTIDATDSKVWVDGAELSLSASLAGYTDMTDASGQYAVGAACNGTQDGVVGVARLKVAHNTAWALSDHQAHCGTWASAPAGGSDDSKPKAADTTWTQTGGASCYPTSPTTAVCQPGGVPRYSVDATGMWWAPEPDAVNRIRYNTAIDCTNWTCDGTPTVVTGVVSPDGSPTASTITTSATNRIKDNPNNYATASAPLYPRFWLKCSTGTLTVLHTSGGGFGQWSVACATIGGDWTLVRPGHSAVTETNPFVTTGANAGGLNFYGNLTFSLWAPTLTMEPGTGLSVIPTAASAVSTGDAVWMINNDPARYWKSGDTVTQSITEYSGTCWDTTDATQIYLTGRPGSECAGIWYSLEVKR